MPKTSNTMIACSVFICMPEKQHVNIPLQPPFFSVCPGGDSLVRPAAENRIDKLVYRNQNLHCFLFFVRVLRLLYRTAWRRHPFVSQRHSAFDVRVHTRTFGKIERKGRLLRYRKNRRYILYPFLRNHAGSDSLRHPFTDIRCKCCKLFRR